jgi:hypothetical protein
MPPPSQSGKIWSQTSNSEKSTVLTTLEPPGNKGKMARREGLEPPTLRFEVSRKGQK